VAQSSTGRSRLASRSSPFGRFATGTGEKFIFRNKQRKRDLLTLVKISSGTATPAYNAHCVVVAAVLVLAVVVVVVVLVDALAIVVVVVVVVIE